MLVNDWMILHFRRSSTSIYMQMTAWDLYGPNDDRSNCGWRWVLTFPLHLTECGLIQISTKFLRLAPPGETARVDNVVDSSSNYHPLKGLMSRMEDIPFMSLDSHLPKVTMNMVGRPNTGQATHTSCHQFQGLASSIGVSSSMFLHSL